MAATVALPRPLAAESDARTHLRLWPEWLILSLYTLVVASAIPFHEPWADEAQAWQMARALSVHDLFFHALRYEGSPGLWHLLLHGLIRLHVSYTAMHWLVGMVAVCGVGLLIFLAPFPRWVRFTLPFTVFLAFQYAVVARSYVLVPLLVFAAAIFWNKNVVVLAILLGLLANTCLHGFALAAALGVVYIVEMRRGLLAPAHPRMALLIFLGFLGFALFTALPPPSDLTFDREYLFESMGERLAAAPILALAYILRAFGDSWKLSLPFVLAILWLIHRILGKLYLLPLLSVSLLSAVSYFNYWHLGLAQIAVVATAWIAWRNVPPRWNRTVTCLFVVWLCVQFSYSVFAFTWDHEYAYSPDKAAAQFLDPFVRQGLPLAVTAANGNKVDAFHSVGLGPYFDHPIFINQPRMYWVWSSSEHTEAQFKAALDQNPAAVVAVFYTNRHRRFDRTRDLDLRLLHPLYEQGYGVTNVFCGEKPEGLRFREEICEIVLER